MIFLRNSVLIYIHPYTTWKICMCQISSNALSKSSYEQNMYFITKEGSISFKDLDSTVSITYNQDFQVFAKCVEYMYCLTDSYSRCVY